MNSLEKWKPVVAMVSIAFAFAIVNILFKKALDEGLNYLVSITYRQLISAILLAPLAYCVERKSWSCLTFRLICGLFISALLGATLPMYFFLIGLKYTSATYACAFINISPVTTFIMAFLFGSEKLNMKSKSGRAKVAGALICFGGVLTLVLYKGILLENSRALGHSNVQRTQEHSAKRWAIGSIFLALACLAWSSWFLVQERIGKSFPFQCSSTAMMSFFSAIQAAVLCSVIYRNISAWILRGPLEISSVIYAGVVGSSLGYVGMSWCIKERGPVFTSAFSPFIQIFAAIFDVFLLHEQIHLGSILGSLLVIVGMYILLWGKRYEEESGNKHVSQQPKDNGDGRCEVQVTIPITTDHRVTTN